MSDDKGPTSYRFDGYTVEAYLRQRARYERLKGVCRVVGYLLAGIGCGLAIAGMLLLPEVTRVAHAAPATVAWIVALDRPTVEMPADMAAEAGARVFCESGWNPYAVNPVTGASGSLQVHPIHFPGMRTMALDPADPVDLVKYAITLWERSGWAPWAATDDCVRRHGS